MFMRLQVDPVMYSMVGAAATISGVTRMTVSLIIIMFELTGSLNNVLPLMITIMVSKWVADGLSRDSLFDMVIKLNDYPYLDHKKTNLVKVKLPEVLEGNCETLQIDKEYTFDELQQKLEIANQQNSSGDGGLPVLLGTFLTGYIGATELMHAIGEICKL
jgi:chloride channel 3/4/5